MQPQNAALDGGHQSKPRLLVVEDLDDTRRHMTNLLRHDYVVDEARDGLDALQKVSLHRYDAILLDLVLPNVDGWQFRQTMLRHPELARIPTVVVTVRALRDADRYALRTTDVLQKPFGRESLLSAVRKACEIGQPECPPQPANPAQLFWSKRGEVACWTHAPSDDPGRWHQEQWAVIPDGARKHRVTYQCQHCEGHDGAVGHRRRADHA